VINVVGDEARFSSFFLSLSPNPEEIFFSALLREIVPSLAKLNDER